MMGAKSNAGRVGVWGAKSNAGRVGVWGASGSGKSSYVKRQLAIQQQSPKNTKAGR